MSQRTLGVQKPVSAVKANARGSHMGWFDQVSKPWGFGSSGEPMAAASSQGGAWQDL